MLSQSTGTTDEPTPTSSWGAPKAWTGLGVHTGPVVTGITVVKKFQYDIWGGTVNIASRMESSGEVNQVKGRETTDALVKNEPGRTFTPRDLARPGHRAGVHAKGKGELEMYFVSRSSEAA